MEREATLRELSVQLHKLSDSLDAIKVVIGGQPQERKTELVDGLEGTVLDTMGILSEARKSALAVKKAIDDQKGPDEVRSALAECREHFQRAQQRFTKELGSRETLIQLAQLGNERGSEWKHWAASVKDAIEQCRQPLEEVNQALASCWRELAES
jgi:uridylate kinase